MKFKSRRDFLLTVVGVVLIAGLTGAMALAYLEIPENRSSSELFDVFSNSFSAIGGWYFCIDAFFYFLYA